MVSGGVPVVGDRDRGPAGQVVLVEPALLLADEGVVLAEVPGAAEQLAVRLALADQRRAAGPLDAQLGRDGRGRLGAAGGRLATALRVGRERARHCGDRDACEEGPLEQAPEGSGASRRPSGGNCNCYGPPRRLSLAMNRRFAIIQALVSVVALAAVVVWASNQESPHIPTDGKAIAWLLGGRGPLHARDARAGRALAPDPRGHGRARHAYATATRSPRSATWATTCSRRAPVRRCAWCCCPSARTGASARCSGRSWPSGCST